MGIAVEFRYKLPSLFHTARNLSLQGPPLDNRWLSENLRSLVAIHHSNDQPQLQNWAMTASFRRMKHSTSRDAPIRADNE